MADSDSRRSIDETWRAFEAQGKEMPRHDGVPVIRKTMPRYGDEVLGLSFYKQHVISDDFSDSTLPRTFFGRSLLKEVSFRNTDLTESNLCWNDFVDCDFRGAILTGCDMRASVFDNCNFEGAIMKNVDLRRSNIEDCDFAGADLSGAIADHLNNDLVDTLDAKQQKAIDWRQDPGPEPEGG